MQDFFPNLRRRVELEDWAPLMNEQGEKRIRLDLLMPLTGEAIVGMPHFVAPAWEKMEAQDSAIKDVPFVTEIEGVTVEAFATDSSAPMELEWGVGLDEAQEQEKEKRRKLLLTSSTLRNFKLVRVTREKQKIVGLRFSILTKNDTYLVLWAYKYHGSTFWCQFTETQPEIKAPEAQMNLNAPETVEDQRADAATLAQEINEHKEPCAYPGCKLDADHDGEHDLKDRKHMTRAEKTRLAQMEGKPRGFVGVQ